jgi:hypothetical protein
MLDSSNESENPLSSDMALTEFKEKNNKDKIKNNKKYLLKLKFI